MTSLGQRLGSGSAAAVGPPKPDLAARRVPRAMWWVALYGAVVGALTMVLARDAMTDDAMITLTFARNLAMDGCWCLIPGIESHTATNPLNVWLLAALVWITGHALWAVGILLMTCLGLYAWWIGHLAGAPAAAIGVTALATAPVVTLSIGLEQILGVGVVLAVARFGLAGRWAPVALAVAAAPLVRPDLAAGAIAATVLVGAVRMEWVRCAGSIVSGALLAAPWFVFSWWHFGSAWPHTFPVKASQKGWGDGSIHLANSWPMFLMQSPVPTLLTSATLVLGALAAVVAIRQRRWAALVLVVGGAVEFLALALVATVPVAYYPAILVGTFALSPATVASAPRWPRVAAAAVAVASLAWTVHHSADLAEGRHPLRQNWATNAEYERIVAALPMDAAVYSQSEIGAFAFYCLDRGCRVVDPYLADPGRVARSVEMWRAENRWADLNYRHYRSAPAMPTRYRVDFTYPPESGPSSRPGAVPVSGGGALGPGTAVVLVGAPTPPPS